MKTFIFHRSPLPAKRLIFYELFMEIMLIFRHIQIIVGISQLYAYYKLIILEDLQTIINIIIIQFYFKIYREKKTNIRRTQFLFVHGIVSHFFSFALFLEIINCMNILYYFRLRKFQK